MRNHLFLTVLACFTVSCASNESSRLHGTWSTDLGPLGHEGHSHVTFNSAGSYEQDTEIVMAGTSCLLDVSTTGTFAENGNSITITHESGTQAVSRCSDATHNHRARAMTADEIGSYNANDELTRSIVGNVLTLTDGNALTRSYTRQ